MTRPIKFRAWDTERKEMVHFDSPNFCHEYGTLTFDIKEYPGIANYPGNSDFSTWKLMQFTGLHDKNGVEIYEGDILLIGDDSLDQDYDEEQDDYVDKVKAEVVYCGEDGYPAFDIKPNPFEEVNGLSHLDGVGRMEVIGNVYENPELLEEKNV